MMLIKLVALVAVLAGFFGVWRMQSGWRLVVTPFLFLGYFELMRVLPPFFLADTYLVTESAGPLLAAVAAFGALLVGFVMAYGYRSVGRHYTSRLTQTNLPRLSRTAGDKVGAVAVLVVLVATGMLLYGGLPPVGMAIAGMFSGGGEELASYVSDQRFELTKAAYFGGEYRGQGVLRGLQRTGWTIIICYAMLVWRDERTNVRLGWFLASLFGGWIFVAGDGTRGPFLDVLLVVTAVYSLRQPLSLRTVLTLFGAGIAVAILLSLYSNKMYNTLVRSDGDFLQEAISKIVSRVFLGNGMNDVYVVDMVNSGELALRWGATHYRNIVSAIPGVEHGPPLAYELFLILNPASRGTTFLSGTYLSIVYVDFGWYGLVPIFIVIGVIIGAAQRQLFRTERSPWGLAMAAMAVYLTVTLLRSGFTGCIAQLSLVLVVFCVHASASFVARAHANRGG